MADPLSSVGAHATSAESQYQLSMAYRNGTGGVVKDMDRAFQYAVQAANQNHAGGQCALGYHYAHGATPEGVKPELALKWTQAAAKQGYGLALYYLGYWYERGVCGLKIDIAKATENYALAAAKGQAGAKEAIARINPVYAYADAAAKGDAHACYRTCVAYDDGIGVEKNPKKALEFALKAANADPPSHAAQW